MVTKDDGHRDLRRLQLGGKRQMIGQAGGKGAAPVGNGAGIVADHMERPEDETRPGYMCGHLMVKAAQKGAHAVGGSTDIGRGPCGRHDELAHADAGGGIFHRRAKACSMGGAGGHHLTRAVNMMERVVTAKAHDMVAGAVGHFPAFVGQPAMQRLSRDLALPAGQAKDGLWDHDAPSNPSLTRADWAAADKGRSAIIAMKVHAKPATHPFRGLALVKAISTSWPRSRVATRPEMIRLDGALQESGGRLGAWNAVKLGAPAPFVLRKLSVTAGPCVS